MKVKCIYCLPSCVSVYVPLLNRRKNVVAFEGSAGGATGDDGDDVGDDVDAADDGRVAEKKLGFGNLL